MNYANSADFGGKLCEALGIDLEKHHVRKVTLSIETGDIARISVEEFMDNEQAGNVYDVVRNYVLAYPPENDEAEHGNV